MSSSSSTPDLRDGRRSSNSNSADRFYPGVPRLAPIIQSQHGVYAYTSNASSTTIHSDNLNSQADRNATFSAENRDETAPRLQVPVSAVARHFHTIVTSEAAINHTAPIFPTMVVSRVAPIDPQERPLLSPGAGDRYDPTPWNSPASAPNPRSGIRGSRTSPGTDTFPSRRRRGGGKSNGGKLNGVKKISLKIKTKKSPFADYNLMGNDKSVLYDPDNRSKLQALLDYPTALDKKARTSLNNLTSQEATHATTKFQEDGQRGFNDSEFVAEAMEASELRSKGDFKEFEDARFEEEWADSEGEEYSDEEPENDVEMSSKGRDDAVTKFV